MTTITIPELAEKLLAPTDLGLSVLYIPVGGHKGAREAMNKLAPHLGDQIRARQRRLGGEAIELRNGSLIRVVTTDASLRGLSADLVVVDSRLGPIVLGLLIDSITAVIATRNGTTATLTR